MHVDLGAKFISIAAGLARSGAAVKLKRSAGHHCHMLLISIVLVDPLVYIVNLIVVFHAPQTPGGLSPTGQDHRIHLTLCKGSTGILGTRP